MTGIKNCEQDYNVYKIMNQKGVLHLVVPLLLLLIVGAAFFVLISTGIIKNPLKSIPFLSKIGQSGPKKVELKKDYKNPFKKDTQYVNPFETYKNPFTVK